MNTIIPNQAVVVKKAVDEEFCKAVISNYPNTNYTKCNLNGTLNPIYRNSSEIKITNQDLIRSLWNQVKHYVPEKCNGKKLVGMHKSLVYLLKYTKGQFFSKHSDGNSTDSKSNVSLITGIVYLNTVEKSGGGGTRFYYNNEIYTVQPEIGDFLYFVHKLVHEGMKIKKGYKYAVRFNILYKK